MLVRLARTYSNGRKSPNRPDSGKVTAKGKGVHREVESEGSRRQTVGPMNKNLVEGWKAWKHPKTRVKNLIKCGIKPYWARIYGKSSKGYWANAEGIMHHAAGNDKLRRAGYPCLMDYYVQLHRV